ncbi:MAG: EamA family transporter, partial [Deltaproteobacteria bacterium]|nr:EamA family transporter [Deltaproteobacteria bacterium]
VFFVVERQPFSVDLLIVLSVGLPLEVYAYYLFLQAIRMAPLSLTIPLLAFTPVFTILTAALIVGEGISLVGGVGILMVTAGAYLLNGDLINLNFSAPIRAIFSNLGSRKMLVVAFLWSITSSLGKKGVLLYGALPFAILLLFLITGVFAVVSLIRLRRGIARARISGTNLWLFLVGGLFMTAMEITHFVSLSLAPVAYMISVKRLSMVFSVLLGWIFFGEENIRYRLVGAALMVAGVFLLYE